VTYPDGVNEEQFLLALDKVVEVITNKVSVVGMDRDDLAQFVRLEAIGVVQKFDPSRGRLGAFLYRGVYRRVLNHIRNTVRRTDPPCDRCASGDYCQEGSPCRFHSKWVTRNNAKASAASPLGLDCIRDEHEERTRFTPAIEDDVATREILDLLDQRLTVQERQVLLRMRAGERVEAPKRRRVQNRVLEVLQEAGVPLDGLSRAV
jgi:DNA-directed RNA polymerase specialized sigma24 family protein